MHYKAIIRPPKCTCVRDYVWFDESDYSSLIAKLKAEGEIHQVQLQRTIVTWTGIVLVAAILTSGLLSDASIATFYGLLTAFLLLPCATLCRRYPCKWSFAHRTRVTWQNRRAWRLEFERHNAPDSNDAWLNSVNSSDDIA